MSILPQRMTASGSATQNVASQTVATEPGIASVIPLCQPVLEPNAWIYVKDALDSGWVSSVGPYVDEFEQRMALHFNAPRTVATASGTAALHIALILAGVQPGDEVIVPSLTFIATINAIRYVGATPVFWDSAPDHFNADPAALGALITPKTRAIMVVHLYGIPVPMDGILAVAQKHGVKVIEDAAEALGASWNGIPCGAIGDIGCLSFNGNKVMTTGNGGLIVSRDEALMQRAHYLINQAKDDALTFEHGEVGYNYRLTNLNAALGVAQLESLPGFLAKKRAISARYREAFAKHPGIVMFDVPPEAVSSDWLSCIALNEAIYPGKTSLDLVRALETRKIQARPFFKPGHEQKPFQDFVTQDLPNASRWHRLGLNLPCSASLTAEEQERVIQAVCTILASWEGSP